MSKYYKSVNKPTLEALKSLGEAILLPAGGLSRIQHALRPRPSFECPAVVGRAQRRRYTRRSRCTGTHLAARTRCTSFIAGLRIHDGLVILPLAGRLLFPGEAGAGTKNQRRSQIAFRSGCFDDRRRLQLCERFVGLVIFPLARRFFFRRETRAGFNDGRGGRFRCDCEGKTERERRSDACSRDGDAGGEHDREGKG